MRTIFAYAREYPEAMQAMVDHCPTAEFRQLDGDTAYFDLMAAAWVDHEPFILVEHDMVIRPGVLDDLAECPNPWCGYAYRHDAGFNAAWGCTKFSAALIAATAGIWDYMREHSDELPYAPPTADPRHWQNLDGRWAYAASRVYECGSVCTHWPALPHLNPRVQPEGLTAAEDAASSPNPAPHRCWKGHPCRCQHLEGHACPIRSAPNGTSGALVHNLGRFAGPRP